MPATDFTGPVTFTYRASAGATTTSTDGTPTTHDVATVTIYVLSSSTLPRFILGSNQRATDEGGAQKVADYATLVSSDGHATSFYVTTDNARLFAAPPTIDASGELSYAPAPNVSGAATVTVCLDDGDATTTDDTETFTIDVTKPHPMYNAAAPCDVNGDSHIAPNDALMVINYVNAHLDGEGVQSIGGDPNFAFYDVNKDGHISPIDALIVINTINSRPAGGEGESAAATDQALLSLMTQDAADSTLGRRR